MLARRTDAFVRHKAAICLLVGFLVCYLTGAALAANLLYRIDPTYPAEYYAYRAGMWWMTMIYATEVIDENKRRARLAWCDRPGPLGITVKP